MHRRLTRPSRADRVPVLGFVVQFGAHPGVPVAGEDHAAGGVVRERLVIVVVTAAAAPKL